MSRGLAWAVPIVAVAAVALGAAPNASAQTTPTRSQHGRLFPPQDLGLLEAPDRDEWQRPQQILDALGVADASIVADVGAGSGWFTVRLARRVGPNGVVYAQDVQPEMLAAITRRVQREGLGNVRPVLGRGSDPHLPSGVLDAVLVVGVVHEIEDRVALFRNLGLSLKPGGRLGVVDFRAGDSGPGPDASDRVAAETIEAEAAKAGLRLQRTETFLPFQYFLIFSRPEAATAGAVSAPARRPAPRAAAGRPPRRP
jgi:SAM-dependent methyltransferase